MAARSEQLRKFWLREEGDPRALGNAAFFDTIDHTGPRKHSCDTWLKNQNP